MIWLLSAAGGGGNQEGAEAPSWTLPGTVDEGPRSAACFYWECLLSAWPLSGFGGGRGRCGGRTGEGKLMEIRTEENGNFTFSKPCPIDEIVGAWYAI